MGFSVFGYAHEMIGMEPWSALHIFVQYVGYKVHPWAIAGNAFTDLACRMSGSPITPWYMVCLVIISI